MPTCRGKLLALRTLGLDVRPAREWPQGPLGYGGRNVILGPSAIKRLRTTQTHVACAVVNAKIAAGTADQVELARDPQGQIWILDGHHALAAYLLTARPPRAFLHHTRGDATFPPPPRFVRRRRAPR